MGYLPQAMVNYLALLGWGNGTENEFFTLEQLVQKFSIGRVNKSGAIFDTTKLRWMNGQRLRALPSEQLTKFIDEQWKSTGVLTEAEGPFIECFQAIGAEYGEGFESFGHVGPLKVDVDFLEDKLQ